MNDMNDIKHHLNDELLLGYSAGALPEAFNLIVATHLETVSYTHLRAHET